MTARVLTSTQRAADWGRCRLPSPPHAWRSVLTASYPQISRSCIVVRTREKGLLSYGSGVHSPGGGCEYEVLMEVDSREFAQVFPDAIPPGVAGWLDEPLRSRRASPSERIAPHTRWARSPAPSAPHPPPTMPRRVLDHYLRELKARDDNVRPKSALAHWHRPVLFGQRPAAPAASDTSSASPSSDSDYDSSDDDSCASASTASCPSTWADTRATTKLAQPADAASYDGCVPSASCRHADVACQHVDRDVTAQQKIRIGAERASDAADASSHSKAEREQGASRTNAAAGDDAASANSGWKLVLAGIAAAVIQEMVSRTLLAQTAAGGGAGHGVAVDRGVALFLDAASAYTIS